MQAIETGPLFLQPPGYFLFNWCGLIITRITPLSAAHALRALNLFFAEAGVIFFAWLSRRRLSERDALLITLCFALSPMLWFAADVHSTYAAMSCFAPLLFLCFEEWKYFELGVLFWALMIGFRPSDGAFVLPWVLWQSLRYPRAARLRGASHRSIGGIPLVGPDGALLRLAALTHHQQQRPGRQPGAWHPHGPYLCPHFA